VRPPCKILFRLKSANLSSPLQPASFPRRPFCQASHELSASARARPAASHNRWLPRAARLDPGNAYRSPNPLPPHHPDHAMRFACCRTASHRLPLRMQVRRHQGAARRVRCCRFPARASPEPAPDRPPSLPARATLLLARQSPPGCSLSAVHDARARTGGLLATLMPRRAARRRVGFSGSSSQLTSEAALQGVD